MPAKALIISRDLKVSDPFRGIFESSGISVQEATMIGESLRLLSKNKYDAVVVNCADFADGSDVLLALRTGRSNRNSIAIAVTGDKASNRSASEAGANFVLECPVSTDRIEKTFRAAHGLILRERHRYLRHPVNVPIFLIRDGRSYEDKASLVNISEGGMAVAWKESHHAKGNVQFRFLLPESTIMINGSGEIMWKADPGQLGIKICRMEKSSRHEVDSWLKQKAAARIAQ